MTVISTALPVGGMPMSSPSCVPWNTLRVTTLSPSATWSRIVARKSGKALRKPSNCWCTPSAPSATPGRTAVVDDVGREKLARTPPRRPRSGTRRRSARRRPCWHRVHVLSRRVDDSGSSIASPPRRASVDLPVFCELSQQVVLHREQRRRRAARDADLRVDVLDVALGRPAGERPAAPRSRGLESPRATSRSTSTCRSVRSGGARSANPRGRADPAASSTARQRLGVERPTAPRADSSRATASARMGRAMRPGLGHGLEDIGGGQNASRHRDAGGERLAVVARAVQPLVVHAGQRQRVAPAGRSA